MTTQIEGGKTVFHKTLFDDGMRVVTSTMPNTRSVSINVFVKVGSRYEPPERAGLSHVVEHLVFKGTERRPTPKEISSTVEGVGGVINAGTEQELTVYWCKVARPHLEECLDLLIDMLRNSLYRPDDIERERMVVFEEQKMVNDYPNYKVDALIDGLLWPDHPLGRDVSGTRESVAAITRETMLDHVSRFYTPGNMVISVAGDVDHEHVVDQVASLCQGWSSRTAPGWTPFDREQLAPQMTLEYRKTEQAHLSIGLPGLSISHPDRYALDLLSVVLGEGMSSRLFLEIREKHGLAYDIHSGVTHFLDTGALVVAAGVDPKRVHRAVETILAEVGRLRDGVPEEELEQAKRLATGRLMLGMEGTRDVSAWMGSQEALTGRIVDTEEVIEGVNGVSTDDLRRVSNDLLLTEKLHMALVGPSRGRTRFERVLKL